MIKDGFYGPAKTKPTPNRGGSITPRAIIVHDTAGGLDAAGSISWLCNPSAKASAHFVIGRDGAVTQLASCLIKTWHAGDSVLHGVRNVNAFSIGIEIVNPGRLTASGSAAARASFGQTYDRKRYAIEELGEQHLNGDSKQPSHPAGLWMPYTSAQLDAVLQLCLAIKEAYGVQEVYPHWFISPGRKIDTNPLFPLRWLRGKMEGRQDTPAAVEEQQAQPLELIPEKFLADEPAGKPEDPRRTPASATVVQPARLREWPSFNDSNVLTTIPVGINVDVEGAGDFFIIGEGMPEELAHMQLHWYKVRHTWRDGEMLHNAAGWVLATTVIPDH